FGRAVWTSARSGARPASAPRRQGHGDRPRHACVPPALVSPSATACAHVPSTAALPALGFAEAGAVIRPSGAFQEARADGGTAAAAPGREQSTGADARQRKASWAGRAPHRLRSALLVSRRQSRHGEAARRGRLRRGGATRATVLWRASSPRWTPRRVPED